MCQGVERAARSLRSVRCFRRRTPARGPLDGRSIPAYDPLIQRWYTTAEVGAELGVTDTTVRQLIRARRLEARVLLGGSRPVFRISEEALERYRKRYVRNTLRDDWE